MLILVPGGMTLREGLTLLEEIHASRSIQVLFVHLSVHLSICHFVS
jgi:hypothetical protein